MVNTFGRRVARVGVGLVLVLAAAGADVLAGSGKSKWWRSEQFQREMGLSADQVSRIDKIFQDALPALHASKTDLDRLEEELSTAIADNTSDEARVLHLIDKVEASRSALGRTRSLMLYRMHRVLTQEQRATLKTLQQAGPQGTPADRPR